jgi:cytochrome o ubiquinol oxidase subunit II
MALPRKEETRVRMFRIRCACAALLVPVTAMLASCKPVLLNPSGDVAVQQGHLLVVATVLMLLIIVPVILLTLVFAWHYRHSNPQAIYTPDWDHSIQLELVIWAAPLLIIIALGAVTWISTHTLDPFRPLSRIDTERGIPAEARALTVEAVALDWKWLFLYPEQGIAVVNEMAAPVDVPIHFWITSESVMNSFFVPALAGQIYAMPGMESQLNAVINHMGDYEGFSANYSGAGFSGMHFRFRGMTAGDFDRWVQATKEAGGELNRETYRMLRQPSARDPVRRYAVVAPDLYDAILNRCVDPGTICIKDMMSISTHHATSQAGKLTTQASPARWPRS